MMAAVLNRGRRRSTLISAVVIVSGFGIIAAMIVSCAPKTVTVELPPAQMTVQPRPCVPHSLTLDSTATRYALIAWNPGCPQERVMRGFNVYVSRTPLVSQYPDTILPGSIRPFNGEVYPGDTLGNPNRETFALENIPNAVRQYVHVRVVNADDGLSLPSNEIEVVCYQQRTVELAASFSGAHDGYSFRKDTYCRTDDLDNDLYFYSKDGENFLCSPSRLGPVNRTTRLYAAGEGKSPAQLGAPSGESAERVPIRPGHNIILETADGDMVGIRIRRIDTAEGNAKIVFDYLLRPGSN